MNDLSCIACNKEKEEEELIAVDKVGQLCQSCYDDGIADHTTYLAVYHG